MFDAKILLENPEANREQFLAMRKDYIGASDVPAILGLSKYRSPIDVWMEKTGKKQGIEDNDVLWYGREHESIVAKLFERRTGFPILKARAVYQHPKIPWLTATPDYLYTIPTGAIGPLECKTAGLHERDLWSESKAPDMAHTQLITQMAVLGLFFGSCAGMVGGSVGKFYHPEYKMDYDLWELILGKLVEFKSMVDQGICPTARADDMETLAEALQTEPGSMMCVDDDDCTFKELIVAQELYTAADRKRTDLEAKLKDLKAKARQHMGTHERAMFGSTEIKVMKIERAGYEVKPTSYTQVKIKPIKK